MKVVALAGGVGAARLLRGLVRVMPPTDLTIVVNTGDDVTVHGLPVSPDLDTIMYTLAGVAHPEQGWGRADETWNAAETLARYGLDTWFQLGDRDLATHVFRNLRLRQGADLATVTAELCGLWGIESNLAPMSNDPVENRIVIADPAGDGSLDIHFQDFLIKRHMKDRVLRSYYRGVEDARPLPGFLQALREADGIVFCPSNPIVSIGPILALPTVRGLIEGRSAPAVGVSPIVGGAPVRGPADSLMAAAGLEVSCAGVAAAYEGLLDTLVIDDVDAAHTGETARAGKVDVVTAQTMMHDVEASTALAQVVVDRIRAG